ncbi:MAG: DUF5011 domain-containing protein [Candidatus Hydrogenedentes bacterium]|nr:DUF5011 domain-containing protein [Candidatus Hydrogenedentota bacterium]
MFSWSAHAQLSLTMAREVLGLDENGFLPPGRTSLDFRITLTSSGNPELLTALAVEERLPLGFAYVSSDPQPDVVKFTQETGVLQFAWIEPPTTFPYSFQYRVNLLQVPSQEVQVRGAATYRTNGPELRSNEVLTTLLLAPCLTFTRISPNGCYTPGENHEIEVTFDASCPEAVTALGLLDTLPEGFTFVGTTGEEAPDASQFDEETNELSFLWIETPAFPFTFRYIVGVPAVQSGNVMIAGQALYRQSGAEQRSPVVRTTLCGEDRTPPILTLIGGATLTVECGLPFSDPGAVATDDVDGDLTNEIVVTGTVDTAAPGEYQLTYNVSDREGNAATPKTRTVVVEDRTGPVIILRGAAILNVECGSAYVDAGAIAMDGCEGDVSGRISASGEVNTDVPGTYIITFTATDSVGNEAREVNRTVRVVDTTPPRVVLLGAATINIECGGVFNDPGATATDICAGDLSEEIVRSGAVDTSTPGAYLFSYDVTDAAGNPAASVTRRVVVADTTPPVITLLGSATVTIECGAIYTDAGATAADSCAGDLTNALARVSTVDIHNPGEYSVRYNVSDGAGNPALTVTRTVIVRDITPPTIRINGSGTVNVAFGAVYTDAGATATDACDGSLTSQIVVDNPVNTGAVGTYQVRYNVTDSAGNDATTAIRTVHVVDTVLPVITLLGDQQISLDCGSGPFDDPGATANDNVDGDLTDEINVTGAVDTDAPGEYLLRYDVEDSSGNDATTVVRRVFVRNVPAQIVGVGTLSPGGDVFMPRGSAAVNVPLTSELVLQDDIGCPEGTVRVTYRINGNVVGSSTDHANDFPVSARLPIGSYSLTATAETLETGDTVVSDAFQFAVNTADDDDGNGFADEPFDVLRQAGDQWLAAVETDACPRAVSMVTWFGACKGNESDYVTLTAVVPDDPTQSITVSAPHGLVHCGEQGILMAAISCDLEGLLGATQGAAMLPVPLGFVAGGTYFEVSLLISDDGGDTFEEVPAARLVALPVYLSLSGLAFTPGEDVTFFGHPTDVLDNPATGVHIVAADGNWSADSTSDVSTTGGVLTAQTEQLSTFGPFAASAAGPVLQVTPAVSGQFLVGTAKVGESVEGTLTLRNAGSGTLDGTATITNNPDGVFSIIGATGYSLDANETTTLRVRFAPAEDAAYTGVIRFSGDINGPVNIQLRGLGTAEDKPFRIFGCGGETLPLNSSLWGDLAAVGAFAFLLCALAARRRIV